MKIRPKALLFVLVFLITACGSFIFGSYTFKPAFHLEAENARRINEPLEDNDADRTPLVINEDKASFHLTGNQNGSKKSDKDKTKKPDAAVQTGKNGKVQMNAQPAKSNGHTIYLTFDDGPGPYTEKLLDILKEHDVKATFFVTHIYSEYENLLRREAKEGHTVAVHSYSHDYNRIYASTDAYWEDFTAMQQVILKQTGEETKMFRFPGGSVNTVSYNISENTPGSMEKLVKEAIDRGLSYFDWNVSSGDAASDSSESEVLQNCKDGAAKFKNAVILCHDIKECTVNVMDEFITWARENGYTFAALTPESNGPRHNAVFRWVENTAKD